VEEQSDPILARRQKLDAWRAARGDPFAVERYERTHHACEAVEAFESLEGQTVALAGRITAQRSMGKATFLDLTDESGRIQLYFKRDRLGEDQYALTRLLDLGDIVGARGELFRTRTGEITVDVGEFTLLAKALRPLPFPKEKEGQEFYGLQDVEQRYRQRYADLAVHPAVREHFRRRSCIITGIRRFLDARGYIEVETPVLQAVAGGAAAKPFLTHYNALDYDFHLRISLELYLKRLIVGGFEKIYEIGRNFRNEGISTRHSPEFTMLESYEAYANLEDIMTLVEQLILTLAQELYGPATLPHGGGTIDISPPWRRLPMLEGIRQYAGVAPEAFTSLEEAKAAGARLGLDMSREMQTGGIIEKIHERFVQPRLTAPTFITDFPLETSPLAKKNPENPSVVRRFEGYIAAQEIANAFSEINDPDDQRQRFLQQAQLAAHGDEEAHPMDEDFLRALEYGMPPTGGLGIGIDRLVMVLTDTDSIRDVILFPQMKPEERGEGSGVRGQETSEGHLP
jgi:lysyl-tRNA synthetase, class II